MRLDVNYSHSKNIGAQVGEFHGVPVNTYDPFDLELDEALSTQRTVLSNQASGVEAPSAVEILPGEVLCSDNIVRRETTAEAMGYDAFVLERPVANYFTGQAGTYNPESGQWEYAHEGEHRQSTPEEMCEFLNNGRLKDGNPYNVEKYIHEVVTDGDDKLLKVYYADGHPLYGFRYVGGLPGTYIGGDEVRLQTSPQTKLAANSYSRVVEFYVPAKPEKAREVAPLVEYEDEGLGNYVPTSNVSRITIGGTALFDPLEAEVDSENYKLAESPAPAPQTCEWYPDGENLCGEPVTNAATKTLAGVCDSCYALRQQREAL